MLNGLEHFFGALVDQAFLEYNLWGFSERSWRASEGAWDRMHFTGVVLSIQRRMAKSAKDNRIG